MCHPEVLLVGKTRQNHQKEMFLLFFLHRKKKKKVYTEKLLTFLRIQIDHSRCLMGTGGD